MQLNPIPLKPLLILSTVLMLCTVGCGSSGSSGDDKSTASILLSSNTSTITADGNSSVSITANVTDSAGSSVLKGTEISFTTNLGVFRNGKQTYSVSTINDSGVAAVSLISPTIPGKAEIRCESSGVSQSMIIEFVHYDNAGLPVAEEFGLSVEFNNMSGLWMAGLEDNIYAHLGDFYGNAVQDGTSVSFKTYNTGGFFDPDVAVTAGMIDDATVHGPGIAQSTLFSTPSPAPAQGFVSVTAETDGGTTTHITSIEVTPGFDNNILYAGTNGGGVYKSTDYGRNWENISRSTLNPRAGENWIDPYIKGHSAICVDPDDHNTVYVGTGYLGEGNLFRSLDGGMNWNSNNLEEWNGLFKTNAAVLTVLCDGDDNDGVTSDYVWTGTEGKGIWLAEDGENFHPSGGIVTVASTPGTGSINSPSLGLSALLETWTLTCFVPDATVNSPSIISETDPVKVEEDNPYAPLPILTATNPDTDGIIEMFTTTSNTKTETWTVTYFLDVPFTNITVSAGKGTVADINMKQGVEGETWTLTCIYRDINASPPLLGDTSTIFSVEGSTSGKLPNANVNTPYSSDTIDFTILPGQAPFLVGDTITFTTVSFWQVSGTVSGNQKNHASTGSPYLSDDGEIGFTINEGPTAAFSHGDYFTFQSYEARPVYWTVEGSKSGLQSRIAQNGEVYTSNNKEISFTIEEGNLPFQEGDQFVLNASASNLSHGWTVWDIVKVPGTHKDTAVLYAATSAGVYNSNNGGKTWNATGSFTGDYVTCLELYHKTTSGDDILYAGTQNAAVWVSYDSGANWTHYAEGMDMGTNIKDIVLDRYNQKLYAVAWYGPRDSATGTIFGHRIADDLSMIQEPWYPADQGLTGSALYTIAADTPDYTQAFFTGGEGISLHKTTGDVSSGNPAWQKSDAGISNLIMARRPVLFSGICSMRYDLVNYGNLIFLEVYIEDQNGNPPIEGSTFQAAFNSEATGEDFNIYDITYPDTYTYMGTFRDPGNARTNAPYTITYMVESGDTITLTYNPACNDGDGGEYEDRGAGCSGGAENKITITF